MTHNLHLLITRRHERDSWATPQASIYVNPVHVDAQGYNLICRECGDLEELAAEVERLKGELDHVLEKAREELQLV
jgi:hypothetical protein